MTVEEISGDTATCRIWVGYGGRTYFITFLREEFKVAALKLYVAPSEQRPNPSEY